MKKQKWIGLVLMILALTLSGSAAACTNFLVSKGASKDGSTFITYAADAHVLYGELYHTAAADHLPGAMLNVYEWDSGKLLGQIKQIAHTFTVVGNMNEYQVAIGETTWGGRSELQDPKAVMDYGSLMYIALQRAKTAREAIRVIGQLMEEYGYASSGESLSISDPNEAWIMEMISKGPDKKGAVWVALKVPEGYVCAHANQARIRTFPMADGKTSITSKNLDRISNNKVTCVYEAEVISLAREKGYFNGRDEEFSYADAYAPLSYGALRFCEARVYAFFNRVAPSQNLTMDYVKGEPGADPLPLWIKPDRKLSVRDVMECMRDHFEGTDFDMTQDVGGGPYRLPYRWRPLTWEVDGVTYCNERAASTQQTGFSFVAQSRSWLPNDIGGVLWFGVDDTYSTVYVPMYCCMDRVPWSFAVGNGSFQEFTWESGFWVFNFVSNYAYSRYSDMIQDIQLVQRTMEGGFLAHQPEIEAAALALYKQAPELARSFLTDYSVKLGDATVKRWKKLGEHLLFKYLDGNVKNELGEVTHPPYPESWYRKIVEETGDHFKIRQLENSEE